MYRSAVPPPSPYVIEEEDGNCIVIAPLSSSCEPPYLHRHPLNQPAPSYADSPHRHKYTRPYPQHTPPAPSTWHPPSYHVTPDPRRTRETPTRPRPYAETERDDLTHPPAPTPREALVWTPRGPSHPHPLSCEEDGVGGEGPLVAYTRHRSPLAQAATAAGEGDSALSPTLVRVSPKGRGPGADMLGRAGARPPLWPTRAVGSGANGGEGEENGSGLRYEVVHRAGVLGPIIVFSAEHRQQRQRHAPGEGAATTAAEAQEDGFELVTPAERAAHARELVALRNRAEAAADALRTAEALTTSRAEALAESMVAEHRETERQRRRQMQDAMNTLREECAELTAQLEAARVHGPPATHQRCATSTGAITVPGVAEGEAAAAGLTTAATTRATEEPGLLARPSDAQQAGWARQLAEVERYWRQRLRTAAEHWESELATESRGRAGLQETVERLTRRLETTEEALRHALSEQRAAAGVSQRKGIRTATAAATALVSAETGEVVDAGATLDTYVQLRQELRERDRRQEALLLQVESYAAENTRMQGEYERKVRELQRELAKERGRSGDLVKLYSSQVQSLHQQLSDAIHQRDSLAARLR